jgi:hypothetical protein
MGYYSEFKVTDTDIPFVVDVLNGSCGKYQWSDDSYGIYMSEVKWYSWEEDLATVAKLYPHNLLIIERYGEEAEDISRAVVKNGNVVIQKPTFVWPEI